MDEIKNETPEKITQTAEEAKTDIPSAKLSDIKEPSEELSDKEAPADPQSADISQEDDDALRSFLTREQEEKKPPKKKMKPLPIIIIAVVVIAGLVAALLLLGGKKTYEEDESLKPAEIELSVTDDGLHEAKIGVDDQGNILQNGTGSLLEYVPADITEIEVENGGGAFTVKSSTPEGEATVYTIVGFEDQELQSGVADEIANNCADLQFIEVVSTGGELKDFGIDEPRATLNVKFSDDTRAVIRVGSDAAGELGAYIAFGSADTVYLCSSDTVSPFLYSVTDLISLQITDTNEDSDTAEFSTLTISGTNFDKPITLEPNKDEALDAAYIVTSPKKMVANATESYDVAGNIRGLQAESVVCVNPSEKQLESYGLSEPYAKVKASYPDTDITLCASAPSDDGLVFVYNPDKNAVYSIQLAAVCWTKTSLEALAPENIIQVKIEAVSEIDFKAGDTSYTFDVSSTSDTTTDESGNEQTVTTISASCDGKELTEDNFRVFFQDLNAIKNQGAADSVGGEVLEFTIRYSTDRDPDAVKFTKSDSAKYAAELNGESIGSASKSYIDQLIESAATLRKGETVKTI